MTARERREEAAKVKAWLRGQRAAERLSADLRAAEGPRPARAVEFALSAHAVFGPLTRGPAEERAIIAVRRTWTRIEKNAKARRGA